MRRPERRSNPFRRRPKGPLAAVGQGCKGLPYGRRKRLLAGVWLLCCTPLAAAQASPLELHGALAQLRTNIEALRSAKGDAAVEKAPWPVAYAAPRHLRGAAQTLLLKANRLALETARLPAVEAQQDAADLASLEAAQGQVGEAMRALGVEAPNAPLAGTAPPLADILAQMLQASRQLSAMLLEDLNAEDVYDLVDLALVRLGAVAGGGFPPLAQLAPGTAPADLQQRLLDCLELAQQAAATRNAPALGLNLPAARNRRDLDLADLYDLAALLLAEVGQLAPPQGSQALPPSPYPRPAPAFPSHVHRLADALAVRLQALAE